MFSRKVLVQLAFTLCIGVVLLTSAKEQKAQPFSFSQVPGSCNSCQGNDGAFSCCGNYSVCCPGMGEDDDSCCLNGQQCCNGTCCPTGAVCCNGMCCAAGSNCCYGTCCYSDETCCGDPDNSFGGICCTSSSFCCGKVQNPSTKKKYPDRCCSTNKVCCDTGLVGCCDPAEGASDQHPQYYF